jgi:hypothetical protein
MRTLVVVMLFPYSWVGGKEFSTLVVPILQITRGFATRDLQFGHHSCGKFATLVVPINYKSFVASPLMICNLGTTRVENSLPPSQLYGNNTLFHLKNAKK